MFDEVFSSRLNARIIHLRNSDDQRTRFIDAGQGGVIAMINDGIGRLTDNALD